MSATSSPQSSHSRSTSESQMENPPRPGISQALRNLFGPSLSADAGKNPSPSPLPSASAQPLPSEGSNTRIFNTSGENKEEFVDAREPPSSTLFNRQAAFQIEQWVQNPPLIAGRKRHCPYGGTGDETSGSTSSSHAQLVAEIACLRTELVQQIRQVEDSYLVQLTELENRIPAAIESATKPLLQRIAKLEGKEPVTLPPTTSPVVTPFSFPSGTSMPNSLPPRPPRGWSNKTQPPRKMATAHGSISTATTPPVPIFGLLPQPLPTLPKNRSKKQSKTEKNRKPTGDMPKINLEANQGTSQPSHETIVKFADPKDGWKEPKLAETVLKAVNEKMGSLAVPRFLRARFISPWNVILLSTPSTPASTYEQYKAEILSAISSFGPAQVKPSVPTQRVIIHGLPCEHSMAVISQEITELYPALKLSSEPRWLTPEIRRSGKVHSSIVVTIESLRKLAIEQEGGIYLFNTRCRVTPYKRTPPPSLTTTIPATQNQAGSEPTAVAAMEIAPTVTTNVLPTTPFTFSQPDSEMSGGLQY
jgi:hypothetical protein